MIHSSESSSKSVAPLLPDPQYIGQHFHPGHWLDRCQIDLPFCTILSGLYERNYPQSGGFFSESMHTYRLSLSGRLPDSKGRLADYFSQPQPQGEVIFIPAGFRYVAGSGPCKKRSLYVFLNTGALGDEDEVSMDIRTPQGLGEFMNLRNDRIRLLLTQINREIHEPGLASNLMIEGLTTTLLAETVRLLRQTHESATAHKGGLAPATLKRIKERILEGTMPPTLAELAELSNLSRRHLMRAFRETTGQTVGQFIQEVTLEKARHLLRETDKPIGMIASELGFMSTSSFSTAFRRIAGESPRAFQFRESSLSAELIKLHFREP